jgi:hypothetical protein
MSSEIYRPFCFRRVNAGRCASLGLFLPALGELVRTAIPHYSKAPLVGRGTAKNPSRLTHEAIGVYVSSRMAAYVHANAQLDLALNALESASEAGFIEDEPFECLMDLLVRTTKAYSNSMEESLISGYDYQWNILGKGFGAQLDTTMPMPEFLKEGVDRYFFGGHFPETIEQSPHLRAKFIKAFQTLHSIPRRPASDAVEATH